MTAVRNIPHQKDVEAIVDARIVAFAGTKVGWGPWTSGVSATAAHLADKTNAINTTDKTIGKMVWDTTNHIPLFAGGTTDVSHWYTVAGVDTITPA